MADLVKFVLKEEGETESPKKEAIKFGDEFYLKSQDGRYFIKATYASTYRGSRYDFPLLGSSSQVKLKFQGGSGELSNQATVQIVSTEAGLHHGNILGAWRDSHNCYYWSSYNQQMQGWQITKVDGGDSSIHYGDKVYFTNLHFTNQRLVPDTRFPDRKSVV